MTPQGDIVPPQVIRKTPTGLIVSVDLWRLQGISIPLDCDRPRQLRTFHHGLFQSAQTTA
jgi:hypothetical protein